MKMDSLCIPECRLPTRPYALKTRGLSKNFAQTSALKNVDFNLAQGEIHALLGQNGAGKSTMMKLLSGFYQSDAGSIELFGEVVHFASPRAARQAGIAMVYQELSLVGSMSVAENLFMGNWSHPLWGGLIDQAAMVDASHHLLKKLSLNLDPHQCVAQLSLGQQQQLEIAKAIAQNAQILILDEASAALSEAEISTLFTLLKTLKAQGVSIIFITHNVRDAVRLCDTVSVLRDGQLVHSAAMLDVTVDSLLAEILGCHKKTPAPVTPIARVRIDRTQPPLLELKNITTAFLHNVSLKIYPGQIVGLVGLLGSGRTQILEAIFGVDHVLDGEIFIAGNRVHIVNPQTAIKLGISLVPEDRRRLGLVLNASVANNVLMSLFEKLSVGLFVGLFINEARASSLVSMLIQRLQVKVRGPEQVVKFLSGGNQQKLVLAKCLGTDARILLLDEPTAGIDHPTKQDIMRIVCDYAAQGNAVIFVTSDYHEIAHICDSAYIVTQGKITQHITDKPSAEKLFRAVALGQ
jgi:ribose transport system ATP-binding protein